MPADEKKDNAQKTEQTAEQTAAEARETAPADGLDFATMDLTVEAVEERISPSETNVFDK